MFLSTDDEVAHRVLLTGGGSGGHVFPALAVGEELRMRGWQVSFAGTAQSVESRVVTARGLDFHTLSSMALLGRGWVQRGRVLLTLARSTVRARGLLRRLQVGVVVATGGYASAPAALGARSRGIPLLLVEPNAKAGLANRWLSHLASAAAIAHEPTSLELRCDCRVTGVPIRRRFFEVAAGAPGPGSRRLLVLGGSQGAEALNRTLPETLRFLTSAGDPRVEVLHQAGYGKAEATRAAYSRYGLEAEVVEFLDDVPAAMAGAHLVLSRSGAITLAEICAAGMPALLFPLPGVSSHQLENARLLEAAGAAAVVTDPTVEEIVDRLRTLLHSSRLETMAAAAHALAKPRAAQEIADMVESLDRGT